MKRDEWVFGHTGLKLADAARTKKTHMKLGSFGGRRVDARTGRERPIAKR
jgi:hypothetical protein